MTDVKKHPVVYLDDDDIMQISMATRRRLNEKFGALKVQQRLDNDVCRALLEATWISLREKLEQKYKEEGYNVS